MTDNTIHLGFGIDEHYITPLSGLISLIHEQNPDDSFVCWVVVADRGPFIEWSRRLSAEIGPRLTVRIVEFRQLSEMQLGGSNRDFAAYITEAMYLRIWLPVLLGESAPKRIIYLDGDIIPVGGMLRELWDQPLYGNSIAAVRDAFTQRIIDTGGLPGFSDLNLDPNELYFNSGVMLIDVFEWQRLDITSKCLEYLAATESNRRFPDQDALNVALYGRWKRINKKWNHMRAARIDNLVESAVNEARIVHCTGEPKPWQSGFPSGARLRIFEHGQSIAEGLLTTPVESTI